MMDPVDEFDSELKALRAVVDALVSVPDEARRRILAYASQRFPAPVVHSAAYLQQAQAGLYAKGLG